MTQPTSYTLTEISRWAESKGKFDLPNVQRGFVWKPYQIEDLWDSLLRGFPIGCFVLSNSTKENKEKYQILDGQQRATAIALGFASKTFRKTELKIKLFIDIGYEPENEKEYLFRVITKSHPWGYEKKDNSHTLDADKIRKAYNFFELDSHLGKSLNEFFPYDSLLPVPFFFLIRASSVEDAMKEIKSWKLFTKIKDHYQKQKAGSIVENFNDYLTKKVSLVFSAVKAMLNEYPTIPALYLNLDKFMRNEDKDTQTTFENENDEKEGNSKSSDAIENLFIRLNNHGTPLRGEELNYSILKANISKSLQDEIEEACELFIRPSRFISILFRVYTNDPDKGQIGNISLKIKPKVFQRAISDKKEGFENYINDVLTEKIFDGKTLLEYAQSILSYCPETNEDGFPYIVYSRIAEKAPEIMLVLLFRLKVKGDRFDESNPKLNKKMLGTISLLYWVGKGDRMRDYTKLLRNIWPSVFKIERPEDFWSKSTLYRAQLNNAMNYFPKFAGKNGLKSILDKKKSNKRSDRNPLIFDDKELAFINATITNNDLIAYSQRSFLHEQFLPIHYGLEDTNVPFDWDHISPQKAITFHNVPKPINSVYSTIGNLRAWPYSLNRKDQAITPYQKFNPLEGEPNDRLPNLLEEFGKKLKKKTTNKSQLKNSLLKSSTCDKEWENCKSDKLRKPIEWVPVYELILKRMIRLYQNWYDDLLIDQLYPVNSSVNFEGLFYKNRWDKNPKDDKSLTEYLDYDNYDFWLSAPILHSIKIYFGYEHGKALVEDEFLFGVIEKSANGLIEKIKILPEKEKKYFRYNEEFPEIKGDFTLISTDSSSYKILLKDIYNWVEDFPDKKLKNSILDYLNKSLKKKTL